MGRSSAFLEMGKRFLFALSIFLYLLKVFLGHSTCQRRRRAFLLSSFEVWLHLSRPAKAIAATFFS